MQTWRMKRVYISGSYRECFTTSILLGHPDYPIRPAPTCKPTRTQRDERSSIRACLCTDDKCNILDEGIFIISTFVLYPLIILIWSRYLLWALLIWGSVKYYTSLFLHFSFSPLISPDFPWFPMISPNYPWFPLISPDFPWFPLISTWFPLVSPDFP